MSSNGRLLRKLRRVMGASVALPSLVACLSQICCARVHVQYNDGMMYITGTGEVTENDVEPVDSVKYVIIEDGVTGIGERTFYDCRNLEKIAIPSTVTRIGEEAFCQCRSLKEINIPKGVTEIGYSTFFFCQNLEKITIPSTVTKIGKQTFMFCDSLKETNIPKGVEEIEKGAFCHCRNLEKITIPSTVTKIGEEAFCSCESLKEINIPEGVTEIGYTTFRSCESLENITIPSTVTEIGEQAFMFCKSLKSVKFNYSFSNFYNLVLALKKGKTESGNSFDKYYNHTMCKYLIGPWLFEPRKLSIGKYAFGMCPELKNFDMPVPRPCAVVDPNAFDLSTIVRWYPKI